MTHFPYPVLDKCQIIEKINSLAASRAPFLFIVDFKAEHGYVIENDKLDARFVRFSFDINHSKNKFQDVGDVRHSACRQITWDIQPLTIEQYKPKFDFVVDQMHRGNSFLTNLTQPTGIKTNLNLLDLYQQANAKYKLWLNGKFVVLSPETFVRIEQLCISSFPMKGTIDADMPNAADVLLNDPKEKAEHATIVDLIRNDLSMVATNVEVNRYRYVEKIITNRKNLLQVSSEISGQLPVDFYSRLGDILFALLPAGSISGAPKQKTLQIIEQAEGYERKFYTGVCGFFDGKSLDSAVMIRFVEDDGEQLIFKSGGGITAQSDLEREYEELIQKVYVPIS